MYLGGARRGVTARRLLSLPSLTVGFQYEFLELIIHFHKALKGLQLQEPEYALLAAMALFSPDLESPKEKRSISSKRRWR